eukprot:393116_1
MDSLAIVQPVSVVSREITVTSTYNADQCKSIEQGCSSFQRLLRTMDYYNQLDVINNKHDQDKLLQYCGNYKSLLDDYTHIITKHNNQKDLDQMLKQLINNNQISKCDIKHCLMCFKHYRSN